MSEKKPSSHSGTEIRARFPEGEPVDVPTYMREHGNPEAADSWEVMHEQHKDNFKNQSKTALRDLEKLAFKEFDPEDYLGRLPRQAKVWIASMPTEFFDKDRGYRIPPVISLAKELRRLPMGTVNKLMPLIFDIRMDIQKDFFPTQKFPETRGLVAQLENTWRAFNLVIQENQAVEEERGKNRGMGKYLPRAELKKRREIPYDLVKALKPWATSRPSDPVFRVLREADKDHRYVRIALIEKALDHLADLTRHPAHEGDTDLTRIISDLGATVGRRMASEGEKMSAMDELKKLALWEAGHRNDEEEIPEGEGSLIPGLEERRGSTILAFIEACDDMDEDELVLIPGDELMGRFEEGKPADPCENMTKAECDEWHANTEKYKDKFSALDELEHLAGRRPRGKGDFALVQAKGLDDIVLSLHPTQEDAEEAMRKRGGEPRSLFTKGLRVVDVGPHGKNEMVEVMGKWMTRPKSASALGELEHLAGVEKEAISQETSDFVEWAINQPPMDKNETIRMLKVAGLKEILPPRTSRPGPRFQQKDDVLIKAHKHGNPATAEPYKENDGKVGVVVGVEGTGVYVQFKTGQPVFFPDAQKTRGVGIYKYTPAFVMEGSKKLELIYESGGKVSPDRVFVVEQYMGRGRSVKRKAPYLTGHAFNARFNKQGGVYFTLFPQQRIAVNPEGGTTEAGFEATSINPEVGTLYYMGLLGRRPQGWQASLEDMRSAGGMVMAAVDELERLASSTMPGDAVSEAERFAEGDEKDAKFEKGKPADPCENLSKEECEEFKANTEKYKDKFKAEKEAAVTDVSERAFDWLREHAEDFEKLPWSKAIDGLGRAISNKERAENVLDDLTDLDKSKLHALLSEDGEKKLKDWLKDTFKKYGSMEDEMPKARERLTQKQARPQMLMPKEIRRKIPKLYSQDKNPDPIAWVKFFNPYGRGTWLITEFDGRDTMFGLADLGFPELGYVSLSELESLERMPGLQQIERDISFRPMPLSQAAKKNGINWSPPRVAAKRESAEKWIPKDLEEGRCTPAPNPDCPVGSPQYNLAQTFKKHPEWGEKGGKKARERMTQRTAAREPSGMYGFTKKIQADCEAASRRLAKAAVDTAKWVYAKDERVAQFLTTHAERSDSLSAKILVMAMQEMGPKFASEVKKQARLEELRAQRGVEADQKAESKTAGKSKYGLYGYKAKTASLGLLACNRIREEAGNIASDLHSRRADKHAAITEFLRNRSKRGRCLYSRMLARSYPNADMKIASVKPSTVNEWLAWEE